MHVANYVNVTMFRVKAWYNPLLLCIIIMILLLFHLGLL